MTETPWDHPMTMAQKKGLSPKYKHLRDLTSLERKVAKIEREALREDPDLQRPYIPMDRAKLRRWECPENRLWPWTDPQVDSPTGRNAALVARFHAAIERLQKARRRGRAALRDDLAVARKRIAIMDQQIADLIGQNRQLRVDLSRARRAS